MKVVLGGNPNSGKTTLFNALTGSNQYVGNWPGVTVEKKEGKLKQDKSITLTDLPGIYSLSPYTLEEVVARNVLLNEEIDVIINIVDASNLERNLYLTTQLLELDIPVVIALNMMDIVNKNGDKIDINALGKRLGCTVVQISALKQEGLDDLLRALKLAVKPKKTYNFTADVEKAIREVQNKEKSNRFIAIKYLEKDEKVLENSDHNYNDLSDKLSKQFDDDVESIITNERYEVISDILNDCYEKKHEGLSISDKIDRIVTNRILGLPIFALIMFVVYYLSITTVGSMATDWVNDVLFPEIIQANVVSFLEGLNVAEWLVSLINDGIIGGVGAVLGFVPQMLVLFFLLAFLEGCGYMARVAFVMDRIFRKFNLSGKSFIPMLIGTGCGVPAIMATRTIENDSDRKMTIMTTTFIPCSAKLPIIGLIAGALFDNAGWVATSAYFVGMAAIIVSGIILKKTK
ncbi:MAG: ferrous iron transport protein B, partial [Erysipelotrichaceae bacterium]|nr:ferrous iron transport protein B [Erysipelotrichaceae bacterium]